MSERESRLVFQVVCGIIGSLNFNFLVALLHCPNSVSLSSLSLSVPIPPPLSFSPSLSLPLFLPSLSVSLSVPIFRRQMSTTVITVAGSQRSQIRFWFEEEDIGSLGTRLHRIRTKKGCSVVPCEMHNFPLCGGTHLLACLNHTHTCTCVSILVSHNLV